MTTGVRMAAANQNLLGTYLKDRRGELDPAALRFPLKRRRTPGLRREEVAQRAHLSATWYTWLPAGRGGAPPAGAVDPPARAPMLPGVPRGRREGRGGEERGGVGR